ncbi:hypothetical protein U1Q18_032296 [Sarracenia purpurea var. burkii]
MSTPYIFIPMWLAYLLADITANFAIRLISNSQWSGRDKYGPFANPDLLAFWVPFLLVHLGGPDTITALVLEDNELWLRHFLDPDPGPNYAKLMDEYTYMLEAKLLAKIEMISEPSRINDTSNEADWDKLSDLKVVQCAYGFFETFKGLIVDLIFSFREWNLSREFFLKRSARDAFLVVEVELNFIYEILYTKMAVVQANLGYLLQFFSFSLTLAASVVFYMLEKSKFETTDIKTIDLPSEIVLAASENKTKPQKYKRLESKVRKANVGSCS